MPSNKQNRAPAKATPLLLSGIGFCLLMLLLWMGTKESSLQGNVVTQEPYLAACTREGVESLFPYDEEERPEEVLEELSEQYHETVGAIVDEYLAQLEEESQESIQCDEEAYETLLQPGESLRELAEQLPLWQQAPEGNFVGQGSISAILNEYLRLFECTLAEYNLFLVAPSISKAERQYDNILLPFFSRKIDQEATIARATLNRTLTALSGLNRLQPLDAELTCLQRASIDIRNAFALTAEASACLPRIWDTRDVLKDL